jgi:hypothetical protein
LASAGKNLNYYRDYLALNSVLCIGGSWLVPADALEAGDYDRITTSRGDTAGRAETNVTERTSNRLQRFHAAVGFCREETALFR